ncbi:MAG: carbohydrate binding family 9 domain-containing protein [Gemmatimonadota bacterium]|jgi:hypothetical protein|nr:carbohydrate binding family 9 domain-containing protein [Gemmatimonadota bacterium]
MFQPPRFPLAASFAFVACSAFPLIAQQGGAIPLAPINVDGSSSHMATAPRAAAVRATGPISIDGRFDEADWATAPVIRDFTQTDPFEGEPVSQRTEVRLLFDDNALYVGAWLYDTGPVSSRLTRRDALSDTDLFRVTIDSYHDHQTAFLFGVNPAGVRLDQQISTGGSDESWDPVWDAATDRTPEGWFAEMRIPLSQLRFSAEPRQTWGIQLERQIYRNQETAFFAFVPKLERGGVQRYGHLDGIEDIRPSRRIELLPYVTARGEFLPAEPENPLRTGSDWFGNAGLDVKLGLNSNLTLDATFNPDFGQVEVDPAVINLTAFETRFEERRPFFVEGTEIFRFGQGGPTGSTGRPAELAYSRRIGRAPQGTSAFSILDAPTETTILGATKITGKFGNGWSVGFVQAVTAREKARILLRETIGLGIAFREDEGEVEPLTSYVIARIRRDANGGATRVGAMVTAVNRDLSQLSPVRILDTDSDEVPLPLYTVGIPVLKYQLHGSAYVAGVDLIHEWDQGRWRFSSSFSPSLVRGDPEALIRTQQASTRYMNRPDATHLGVDSTATSLTGYYAMAELNRVAGVWTGRLGFGAASPGYEVNDLGFQSYADRLIIDTHLQYNQTRPGRFFRNWNIGGGPDNIWNYEGRHVMSNINTNIVFNWVNYWRSNIRLEYIPSTFDDRLTRGGPMSKNPRSQLVSATVTTDSRKNYSFSGTAGYTGEQGGGFNRNASLSFNYRPRESWEFRLGPSYTHRSAEAQYLTSVVDVLAEETFGWRYIFGALDQKTISMDMRLNVTFTPALSFQLYMQPLVSAGNYSDLKELRAPGTFSFNVYGRDVGTIIKEDGQYQIKPVDGPSGSFSVRDRDFNVRSVLGNAVLRWEWRRGSTIYLVWQQSRDGRISGSDPGDFEGVGRLDFGRDMRDLLDIRPDNIFALKINYWLNP